MKDERRKRRHGRRTTLGRCRKKGRNIGSVDVVNVGENSLVENNFQDISSSFKNVSDDVCVDGENDINEISKTKDVLPKTTESTLDDEGIVYTALGDDDCIDKDDYNRVLNSSDHGIVRPDAMRQRRKRGKKRIIDTIIHIGSFNNQVEFLKEILESPELQGHLKSLGLDKFSTTKIQCFDNMTKMLVASKTKGNVSNDKKSFQYSVLSSIVDSPTIEKNMESSTRIVEREKKDSTRSLNQKMLSEALKVPLSTLYRNSDVAVKKRCDMKCLDNMVTWASIPKRKGYTKITPTVKKALIEWIENHDNIKHSSSTKEVIKVKLDGQSEKIPMQKLYMQISVKELHADMLKPSHEGGFSMAKDSEGKPIISQSMLHTLIPPYIKPMSMQKRFLCACEICVSAETLQSSLNYWRLKNIKRLDYMVSNRLRCRGGVSFQKDVSAYKEEILVDGSLIHKKASQAAFDTFCSFSNNPLKLPRWHCVLQCCNQCPPLVYPSEEKKSDPNVPKIKFHIYKNISKCNIHGDIPILNDESCKQCELFSSESPKGKIYSKKELVLCEEPIDVFHKEFYRPAITKLAYHLSHVSILGTNHVIATRRDALNRHMKYKDIKCRRDYAERLSAAFDTQTQSEYYGSKASLSIEGVAIEYYKEREEGLVENFQNESELKGAFFSYISDDSKQDAATTYMHSSNMLDELLEQNIIKKHSTTLWEETDGCAKQYRCATAMYFMSLLAVRYNIVVDRAVGAPGHGKDVVDGLNAIDKEFLKRAMMRNKNPEDNHSCKDMFAHGFTLKGRVSFAEKCHKLLQENADMLAKMNTTKNQKHESNQKYRTKHYRIQKKENVLHKDIKMGWCSKHFPNIAVVEGKKKIRGSSTVLSHYHYRADPLLGEGKCAMRRIPCACLECTNQLSKPWIHGVSPSEQPRYSNVVGCKYHSVLGNYNQWIIMDFSRDSDIDDDCFDEIHKILLDSIGTNMAELVEINSYGAININDSKADGFYIVKFVENPHTLQESVVVNSETIEAGSLVCSAHYMSPARGKSKWYLGPEKGVLRTLIKMTNVLVPKLNVSVVTSRAQLGYSMKTLSEHDIKTRKPFKLTDDDYDAIMEEQNRRSSMEYTVTHVEDEEYL